MKLELLKGLHPETKGEDDKNTREIMAKIKLKIKEKHLLECKPKNETMKV